MLDKNALLGKFKRNEKTIQVKAWGDEVKIQQLSIKEKSEIEALIYGNATPKELEKGSFKIDIKLLMASRMKAVSYSLVEPLMSVDDLESLIGEASEGINEIYKEIEEYNVPKK